MPDKPDALPVTANSITIVRPDDWHLHLRDGDHLRAVLPDTAKRFARAIVMPNLRPPVTTTKLALEYRCRILAALPQGARFEPLMTLYLTDNTRPEEIAAARASGAVHAVKYYPAGATTNSDSGVTDIAKCHGVLNAMEKQGMPLLVHGEVTDSDVDLFDRERVFIARVLEPLVQRFAGLKIVMEHITTREAAEFVATHCSRVASGRTTIACPWRSARATARRWCARRSAAIPSFFWVPTARRTHAIPRKRIAGVPGSIRPMRGSSSMPRRSPAPENSTGWRASRASTVPGSTGSP
jgi:dihydroorotase